MKKVISFLLAYMVVSGILINTTGTGQAITLKAGTYIIDSDKDSVKIETNKFMSKDDDISITLKIPVINGMKNRKIQKSINTRIDKTIADFKEQIVSQARKDKVKMHPYEVFTSCFTSYNRNNLLSLTLELYSYTGGAHGMTYRVPFNIDLNTGKQLVLKDLFKEGINHEEIIDREIIKKIEQSEPGSYFEGAFKGITKDQPYYIKDGAIVIYFSLYEIAPYAAGFPEFEIPFSLFGDGLKINK